MKRCKSTWLAIILCAAAPVFAGSVDTSFVYQGQLKRASVPVTDTCDFEFSLWDNRTDPSPDSQVGPTLTFSGVDAVSVIDGLFNKRLDFGEGIFDGNDRYLQIAVRCPPAVDFTVLAPRQTITGTPYALFAREASWYDLLDMPADISDGDDDTVLTGTQVEDYITDGPIDLAAGTTMNGQLLSTGSHTTDTNAATRCAGANVFLDGNGNCVPLMAGLDGHSLDAADGNPMDAIFVDDVGRVGIGTTTPMNTLSVDGTVKILSHPASYSLMVQGLARFYDQLTVGTGSLPGVLSAKLRVDGGGIGVGHGHGVFSENAGGTSIGAGFGTNDDNLDLLAGGLSRIRVLSTGQTGIGTLSPGSGELLDVNGRVRSRSGGFKFPDGTVQTTAANDHHSLDADDGSPTDALYVSSLGFVGIGTTSPTNHLSVQGSTYLKGNVTIDTAASVTALTVTGRVEMNERLTMGDDIWLNAGQGVYVLNGPGFKTTATNDLDFYTGTGSASRLRLTANGSVGIGVTDPDDKLEVSDGIITVDSGASAAITGMRIRENNDMRWTILYRTWQDDDLEILNEMTGDVAMIFKPDNKVGVVTQSPSHPFEVGTNTSNGNGAYVTTGGVWTNTSDRNTKKNFAPIEQEAILEKVAHLPVTQWQYLAEDEDVRHIGPTAQDFHEAFGLGESDTHIGTLDADGVALAAIQALDKQLKAQERRFQAEIEKKDAQIARLNARLVRLEKEMDD